jgi:DNA repair exonuclease SbcCD nuclease subunit
MRVLIYGDVHWSTYSSIVRSRGVEYSTRLENLIKSVNWAEELADKEKCETVVCLGDFFDRPDLNAEELSALQRINWAKESVKQHHFIVGNHESTLSSLVYNSANVLRNKNFNIVDGPQRIIQEKADILFLPYILEENRKTIKEYWDITEPQEVYYPEFKQNKIIFSHNDLKNVQYGYYTSTEGFDLADIETNSDLYINGHIHNGMFINKNDTILNLGILSGQNFNEDAYRHPHYVCVLDTETLKLDFFENPYAFNFYKVEVSEEKDLKSLYQLKNNTVLTLKCEESLLDKAKEILISLSTVVEYRIISYKKEIDDSNIVKSNQELIVNDHLSQFYKFILDNISDEVVSKDVLKEELNKVIS